MLKMTQSLDNLIPSRNDGSKPDSSKKVSKKLVFGRNDGDNEDKFDDDGGDDIQYAKKSKKSKNQKLSKSKKSKSEKTSKS